MKFMENLGKQIYKVLTENEDIAYSTSGSYCLDLFSLIGGMRHYHNNIISLFLKAFYEDKKLALKYYFILAIYAVV